MTAAPHCHELSRQSPSRPSPFRVRACAYAGAPACIGINRNCRVSARQCAAATGPYGLPPVGHDVGPGCGRADRSDDRPALATAAHAPTSPKGRGRGGLWVTGVGRHGVGTSRGGTGPLRRREQPQGETEFVCLSDRRARGLGGSPTLAQGGTWANGRGWGGGSPPGGPGRDVGERGRSGGHPGKAGARLAARAGRAMRKRQERRAAWPAGKVMNGVGNAARSEA